jgi:hypothetical protein
MFHGTGRKEKGHGRSRGRATCRRPRRSGGEWPSAACGPSQWTTSGAGGRMTTTRGDAASRRGTFARSSCALLPLELRGRRRRHAGPPSQLTMPAPGGTDGDGRPDETPPARWRPRAAPSKGHPRASDVPPTGDSGRPDRHIRSSTVPERPEKERWKGRTETVRWGAAAYGAGSALVTGAWGRMTGGRTLIERSPPPVARMPTPLSGGASRPYPLGKMQGTDSPGDVASACRKMAVLLSDGLGRRARYSPGVERWARACAPSIGRRRRSARSSAGPRP